MPAPPLIVAQVAAGAEHSEQDSQHQRVLVRFERRAVAEAADAGVATADAKLAPVLFLARLEGISIALDLPTLKSIREALKITAKPSSTLSRRRSTGRSNMRRLSEIPVFDQPGQKKEKDPTKVLKRLAGSPSDPPLPHQRRALFSSRNPRLHFPTPPCAANSRRAAVCAALVLSDGEKSRHHANVGSVGALRLSVVV
jgi:hypothetical protein